MEQVGTQSSSYDELRSLVEGLLARVEVLEAENAELRADNTRLRTENAALKRKLGSDSTNSSTPPSQDSLAAKGKRRAQRSQRVRSKDRKRGGQPGHKGSGLTPAVTPDRSETAPAPEDCSGCGTDLVDDSGGRNAGTSWTQIWDIPPIRLKKAHYVLPRRRCACCGKVTTAVVPFGQPGAVVYGPNVNAAAILLASAGNVPVERTAMLMAALLASPVSTGFVARAHQRLTEKLTTAGFDEAMSAALSAEPVLCGDETPVNVLGRDTDERGEPVPGSPHVACVRTPDERLVWYRALPARTKVALRNLGLLGDYTGYLVRDDYVAWHQFDSTVAGVQQCAAHLFRHLQDVLDLHPTQQAWARTTRTVLREAHQAVQTAKAAGRDRLDPTQLAKLRARYDKAVAWGQTTNRHRDWDSGNHPGYTLAKRLADKADQVWLFTTIFAVPWTNNASEQALKSPKLHQKVSGYWHTPTTLAGFCRVRSYLTSAYNHGLRAIDAIHQALTGNPWLPNPGHTLTPSHGSTP